MDNNTSINSAQIIEAALLAGSRKTRQERQSLLSDARDKALILNDSDSHRDEVEARYLEKILLSACMFGGDRSEISEALDAIMRSSFITEKRRKEFEEIALRHIP